ncbi:MAG: ADP-ribosylglycohydrolase family protein [Bacteroidia bacterium]|nr:ADP-ribosylglycohydrolase family protein [Bacteroidia bacterium]
MNRYCLIYLFSITIISCQSINPKSQNSISKDPQLVYKEYQPSPSDYIISRSKYKDQFQGFWLGACIANWTGLVTEMDKIGNIGEIKTGDFYTREDWGKTDQPNIWDEGKPSTLSETIDFVIRDTSEIWGADDDTDIEYMYQHLLYLHQTSSLTGQQIREGWIKHIKAEEENYLWVSNQQAYDLMRKGMISPTTSDPENNSHYDMIDAQLTTEIFGLFAPARPDIALSIANLPIRTTARQNAALISEFYVILHSLASKVDPSLSINHKIQWMADQARVHLPDTSYTAKMFDYVQRAHQLGWPWEQARDSIYIKYQVNQEDGYDITSQNLYCNGCFAAGINYAASLVSLFYGEGDIKETIKIGTLTGWDSDNPTATWGGLLGFMIGKKGIEFQFGSNLSNQFHIHRTRQHFPNDGIDSFERMAEEGVFIVDRVVQESMGGGVDLVKDVWYIPQAQSD